MKCYLGDPCYVIRGEAWDKVVKDHYRNGSENSHHIINGYDCFIFNTAHGDGVYALKDDAGNVVAHLGVDAGMIGAVPVAAITDTDNLDLGYVCDVDLSSDTCTSDEGDMTFDYLTVKTSWSDYEHDD